MKIRLNIICAIVGLCLVLPITAVAAEHEEINLGGAIQTALRENLSMRVIREKVKVAQAQIDGIALLGNPELETEFVGGAEGEQILELTKSFQLGGQRKHRQDIAKTHLEKVSAELAEASRLLTKSVKLTFYALVLAQEKLELTKTLIQHNEQMRDIAQLQFEVGDISVTQVNLANIQLQSAQREAATLQSELALAQLELNGLMGTPLETKPIAVGGLPENISSSALKQLTLQTLTKHAIAHRADLKKVHLNAQLTESEHRLAKAVNIPDLGIGAIAERSAGEYAFGVKFSIPLPIFDRNRADIHAAKAQQQVDATEIRRTERQIAREVMAALLSLKIAQKVLTFYEGDTLKLLNENLKLTRTAYELGEAGLLEVILMQNQFSRTQFAYLNTLSTYCKAVAELEAAVGTSIHAPVLAPTNAED